MSSRISADHESKDADVRIPVPADKPAVRRRRAGKRTALAAHGEPMVWLTGGCLAICLAMIVGLLGMVFWQGVKTFWPLPVIQVTTVDGKTHMGEPARVQHYRLTESMVEALPDSKRAEAAKLLTQTEAIKNFATGEIDNMPVGEAVRRLYRTGNYRLTSEHFNWVNDYEVVETTRPEWAMVIEREGWGRFYGFPEAFVVQHLRPIGERERMLVEVERLLSRGVRRLPTDQRPAAEAVIAGVKKELQAVRSQAVVDFIDGFKSDESVQRLAQLDNLETVALDALKPDQNVRALHEVWEGEQASYQRFREQHAYVRDNLDRIHEIDRYEGGAARKRERNARLELREIELAYGKRILKAEQQEAAADKTKEERGGWIQIGQASRRTIALVEHGNEIVTQLSVIEQVKLEQTQRAELLDRVRRQYGKDSPRAALLAQVIAATDRRAGATAAEAQAEIDKVRQRMGRQFTYYGKAIGDVGDELTKLVDDYIAIQQDTRATNAAVNTRIAEIKVDNQRFEWRMRTAQGQQATLLVADVVRAYAPQRLGFGDKVGVYFSRWVEFLAADPREANQEGGVFPQIVGTVLMTIIMAIVVVPFGVMAAMYLREYARAGPIISAVRIAINNLAGVPSIVFGVFGLGFFCYMIGGYVDGGPSVVVPGRQWFILMTVFAAMVVFGGASAMFNRGGTKTRGSGTSMALNAVLALPLALIWVALLGLAVVTPSLVVRLAVGFMFVVHAIFIGLAAQHNPNDQRSTMQRVMFTSGMMTCVLASITAVFLVAVTPFFDGFYAASVSDGSPTFGKGALIWASFTLALLTLPVVIVATEEALAAVPNSMREGSYACGASKWQTIKRIVLPRAMPGIMTGMILAMARGAGEVAPLMLVGAVKIAPELPISTEPPFGVNRSFLHLGFHIYDLGFQSPNAEAAKPMVFTTTLLLILIIALLNIVSIWLRTRLRKKFESSAF